MMDAVEDEKEAEVHRASAEILPQFQERLQSFLRKTLPDGRLRLRRWVRERDLLRMVNLVEPFQEEPQLLDPYLEKLLPLLSDALIEYLRLPTKTTEQKHSHLLVPMSEAVCKLLYTFCKVRGEKVVVRFFNAETRHLELLLSAIETASASRPQNDFVDQDGPRNWSWEERYICLLWLSHLLLAPFDLTTISSEETQAVPVRDIRGLALPAHLPGIALRVVPLAIRYLSSPGKERDAARVLLVRISMRRDMQELGLLNALVQWTNSCLQSSLSITDNSPYFYIGVLSFLGGILVSSMNTSDMNRYLPQIFRIIQNVSEEVNVSFKTVHSSAVARKAVIKVLRSITVLLLLRGDLTFNLQNFDPTEVVEYTISHFLESLSDNDTPVRLAASKALSVITLKLAPEMAAQVVDAVLESLNRNVLWHNDPLNPRGPKLQDLSAVNPLEWHGLMLTLSHLLYRRSPPPSSLPHILHALLVGLTFEQRSTSGSSVGTNVRDAACFGIWSLARRYTTSELQAITTSSVSAAERHNQESSILQILATELVVSGCLDPVGNIRRGASASLQELIGRHPDTITQGITVVQTVDYHSVALRSRAMIEVSSKVALLSVEYENALVDGLLGWRGIGDGDAASRRNASTAIGSLAMRFEKTPEAKDSLKKTAGLIERIDLQLGILKAREIDQRHGLLLSMAAALFSFSKMLSGEHTEGVQRGPHILAQITSLLKTAQVRIQEAKTSPSRRPDVIAEATSRLIAAVSSLIRIACYLKAQAVSGAPPHELDSLLNQSSLESVVGSTKQLLSALQLANAGQHAELREISNVSKEMIKLWLYRKESEVITAATDASFNLALIVNDTDRAALIEEWLAGVSEGDGRDGEVIGFFYALSAVFPVCNEEVQGRICGVLLKQWNNSKTIESKVALLQSLNRGSIIETHMREFVVMIGSGLDDYTTDARGDIGSLVRIEAVRATKSAFLSIPWQLFNGESRDKFVGSWFLDRDQFTILYGKILRLAAEKLDKVRAEAQQVLAVMIHDEIQKSGMEHSLVSSYEYFRWLLDLQTHDWLALPLFEYEPSQWKVCLLEGYVSSADTGSESLIRASRAALVDFCEAGDGSEELRIDLVCSTLVLIAKKHITNDRVLVPVMEVMSYLFDAGIMQRSKTQWRSLYLLIQKAHYKSASVRKLEDAVKLYGGLLEVYPEAIQKLVSMLLHPFPNIRNQVVDTLYVSKGIGKGINWVRASKAELAQLRSELGIQQ